MFRTRFKEEIVAEFLPPTRLGRTDATLTLQVTLFYCAVHDPGSSPKPFFRT